MHANFKCSGLTGGVLREYLSKYKNIVNNKLTVMPQNAIDREYGKRRAFALQ